MDNISKHQRISLKQFGVYLFGSSDGHTSVLEVK